jgi:signal transduction histidine kinase
MARRTLLLLMFFASSLSGVSQPNEVDSLTNALERASSPEERADILNGLSSVWFHYDVNKSYEFSLQAEQEARQANYPTGIRAGLIYQGLTLVDRGAYADGLARYREAEAFNVDDELRCYNEVLIGTVFQALAHYDSSEVYYRKAIDRALRLKSDRYIAYAYKNFGKLLVRLWRNTEAENYFNQALVIYKRRNNHAAFAETLYALADARTNLGKLNKAHELIEEACGIADSLKNDELLKLYCAAYQGEIHFEIADYPESLRNYLLGLSILEEIEMPVEKARILRGLGDVYEALGQNDVAAKYYLESLKIAEAVGIKYEIANVQASVYYIYKNQRNFRLSHQYIDRSIALRTEIGDKNGLGHSYNGKGVIYFDQAKYDSALIYFDKALKFFNEVGNRMGMSKSTFNKGRVMQQLKRYNQAIEYFKTVLPIEEEIQNSYHLGVAYNAIGDLYLTMGDFSRADDYLTRGQKMAEATTSKTLLMNNSYLWYRLYKAQGRVSDALRFHEKYLVYNDSIFSDMSAGKLAEMEALYQLEKKNQEITLLGQEKQLKDNEIKLQQSRINLQTILLGSIVTILLMVSYFAFASTRYNKRLTRAHREITEQKEEIQAQSEELIEANSTITNINKDLEDKIEQRTAALTQAYKELDTFFYRSSHDFRRPLTTFLGLAEVANVTVKDPNALELFEKVRDTAINLDKMLVKLQSISDVGSQQMVYKEVLLKEIFDTVCNDFRDELQKRNIKTTTDIRLTNAFVSYPAMVKTVIENIVENAIQFCSNTNPYIKFNAYSSGQYITLDIQDNGHGINKEYHEQIFEMYFRGSERSKGNGLGLYIVKKAVDKLEGSITVSSVVNVGTTFTIMLPNKLA